MRSSQFSDLIDKLAKDMINVLSTLQPRSILAAPSRPPKEKVTHPSSSKPAPLTPPIRIGSNEGEFTRRLSQAQSVTLIGVTHQNLTKHLEGALASKRQDQGFAAFWNRIRVVFLSENLLHAIDDELADQERALQDATARRKKNEEATTSRKRNSAQAKRLLSRFLIREGQPKQWRLYEYEYTLPFQGALFELPNGEKIVQVTFARPGLQTSQLLALEFSSSSAASEVAYFQAGFEEVIDHSRQHHEVVLMGHPAEREFYVSHARFRRDILREPSPDGNEWVAAVLILLWQRVEDSITPILQIRTRENSTRELDTLSNLSGYVDELDCPYDAGSQSTFVLSPDTTERTVQRELLEELGVNSTCWQTPRFVENLRYYYQDREHLYFYVHSVEFTATLDGVSNKARLNHWQFDEILNVHKSQVLAKAAELMAVPANPRQARATAIVCDNLLLHGQAEFAQRYAAAQEGREPVDAIRSELEKLRTQCQVTYDYEHESIVLKGLPGLQYREFFTSLVPAYAQLGVSGAKNMLVAISSGAFTSEALDRLKRYYRDPQQVTNSVIDV
jgi:hypothetical protein